MERPALPSRRVATGLEGDHVQSQFIAAARYQSAMGGVVASENGDGASLRIGDS